MVYNKSFHYLKHGNKLNVLMLKRITTKLFGLDSSVVRVSALGVVGCRFEPRPHHSKGNKSGTGSSLASLSSIFYLYRCCFSVCGGEGGWHLPQLFMCLIFYRVYKKSQLKRLFSGNLQNNQQEIH